MSCQRFAVGLVLAVLCGSVSEATAASPEVVRLALESIQAEDLRRHVTVLASDTYEGRAAGSRGGRAAAIYLGKEYQRLRLRGGGPEGERYYQDFGQEHQNILGVLPGNDPQKADEIVLIGAHYDHVGYGTAANSNGPIGKIHNGADDNASGSAALIELAEALVESEVRPERTILFALWDGEEAGLLGSKHWVAEPTFPLARVKFVINMDMLGRLRDGKLEVGGVRTARGLRQLAARHNPGNQFHLDLTWELLENSDHAPFYQQRIPFLMPFTGYHDDYHRPSDDIDKVNFEGLEAVTRWTAAVVMEMASAESLPPFREAALRENNTVQKRAEVPPAEKPNRLHARWKASEDDSGVILTQVTPRGAAARAGLRSGDLILEVDGQPMKTARRLAGIVLSAENPLEIRYRPNGAAEARTVTVSLDGNPVRVGIAWREDDAEPGVVILSRVDFGSWAEYAGLRPNDRVLRINGQEFADVQEFRTLLFAAPFPLTLEIERNGQIRATVVGSPATPSRPADPE